MKDEEDPTEPTAQETLGIYRRLELVCQESA